MAAPVDSGIKCKSMIRESLRLLSVRRYEMLLRLCAVFCCNLDAASYSLSGKPKYFQKRQGRVTGRTRSPATGLGTYSIGMGKKARARPRLA